MPTGHTTGGNFSSFASRRNYKHPFIDEITKTPFPHKWKAPTVTNDGTTDPNEFISIYSTDCPIQKILEKPDLTRRLSAWSIKLSKFSIRYELHDVIKAQCLEDFANNLQDYVTPKETWWTMHVDSSSNPQGVGAGIVLEGPGNILIEQPMHLKFKTLNNQVEYEAIIVCLNLSKEVGLGGSCANLILD